MGGSTAARSEGVGRRRPLRSSTGAFIFRHGTRERVCWWYRAGEDMIKNGWLRVEA